MTTNRTPVPAAARADAVVAPTPIGATEIKDVAAQDIKRALDRLSAEHRAVLVEICYRRRPLAEAAEHGGIPLSAVKSRLYHALRRLHEVAVEMGLAAPEAHAQAA